MTYRLLFYPYAKNYFVKPIASKAYLLSKNNIHIFGGPHHNLYDTFGKYVYKYCQYLELVYKHRELRDYISLPGFGGYNISSVNIC